MSITKFANDDINFSRERLAKIESDLLLLKMEKKTPNSMALQIIGNGINKDGDILRATPLIVPDGKAVTFLMVMYSLYQDFDGTPYLPGANASFLTAESNYLVWNVLGINAGVWNPIQLTWAAGNRRTYISQWVFGPGTYSNLTLYARIEEQNSTPQYRCAPYWAFWAAYMSIYRYTGWGI